MEKLKEIGNVAFLPTSPQHRAPTSKKQKGIGSAEAVLFDEKIIFYTNMFWLHYIGSLDKKGTKNEGSFCRRFHI